MNRRAPYGGVGEATRYCGNVKVACRFNDAYNEYVCRLSLGRRRLGVQTVGLPGSWASLPEYRDGVDSPKAFDGAAHAAIAFALDDGEVDEADLAFTDSGYRIRRKR